MENTKASFSGKRVILICSIVLVVAILIGAIFLIDLYQYNTGVVRNIAVKSKGDNQIELNMTYFLPMGGWSVEDVPLDEGEYTGDGMTDYDGGLGKYRIIVRFGDMAPHRSITMKNLYKDRSFNLGNTPVTVKAKIAKPADHGFVLYIGSDTPIHVESMKEKELSSFCGTIRIPIYVGEIK